MKKTIVFILLLSLSVNAFAEKVYDANGRLLRDSIELTGDTSEPSNVQDVVKNEEKKEIQDELSFKFASDVVSSDRNFGSKEIEESHASSITDFLITKGFYVIQNGGAGNKKQLSYRGYSGFCVKVYLDGVLVNESSTGEFDWDSVDINQIETIVIADNPRVGVSEFAGCSVFIKTKSGKGNFLTTDTVFSTYETKFFDGMTQSVLFRSSSDKFSYTVGAKAGFLDNEYYRGKDGQTNEYNFNKLANANFNWYVPLSKYLQLSGRNGLYYNKLKDYGTGSLLTYGVENDVTTNNYFKFTGDYGAFKFDTILSYNLTNVFYLQNPTVIDTNQILTQNVSIRENLRAYVDISAGYKFENLYQTAKFRNQFDLGISYAWDLKSVIITPCLQVFAYGWDKHDYAILPRLTFKFIDMITLGGYRNFTLPTFNQLYWVSTSNVVGNPDLKPEDGWTCLLSFKKNDFPLWANFTYSYYSNKIIWATVNGKTTTINTENADYFVLAVGYEDSFFNDKFKVGVDGNFTRATSRATGKQIMWVPLFQVHSSLAYSVWKLTFSIDYTYTHDRYADNENTKVYEGFHMLDAGISFAPQKEFELYFKGSNLIDERVAYHDNYYLPSRKWTLGFRCNK